MPKRTTEKVERKDGLAIFDSGLTILARAGFDVQMVNTAEGAVITIRDAQLVEKDGAWYLAERESPAQAT